MDLLQETGLKRLPNLNDTVLERFTPEDIQLARGRAESFLQGLTRTPKGDLVTLLMMYDLRQLEIMFEDTVDESDTGDTISSLGSY